jgi:serine/threonine-protein kinase
MSKVVIAKRYEILSRVGEGGMGTVYRALDRVLARDVAIKMLREPLGGLRERKRFMREARSAAALSHPNIVTIHDFGHDQKQPFIVMELIDGSTLAALIETHQSIDVVRKLDLIREVGDGLEHAHQRRVVHLDIKPSNVIVDSRGVPKILDFGIARAWGDSNVTSIRGTPSYMAPEQFAGAADHRSDIFAMGALLYELLSGARAFPGSLDDGLLAHILDARYEPLPRTVLAQVPGIETVLNRTLAKDPAGRYHTIAELNAAVDDLRRAATRAPVEPAGVTDAADQARRADSGLESWGSPSVSALAVGDMRARMISARSPNELRRLKYEVDQYLSGHEHDVDARLLRDDIEGALLAGAQTVALVGSAAPRGSGRSSHDSWTGTLRYSRYLVITASGVLAAASGIIWMLNRPVLNRPGVPTQVAVETAAPSPASPPPAAIEMPLEGSAVGSQHARLPESSGRPGPDASLMARGPNESQPELSLPAATRAPTPGTALPASAPPTPVSGDGPRPPSIVASPIVPSPTGPLPTGSGPGVSTVTTAGSPVGTPTRTEVPLAQAGDAKPPVSDEQYAKDRIQELLKAYCDAYDALDPLAVQRLYPTVDLEQLRNQLNRTQYKSVDCKLGALTYVSLDAAGGKANVKAEVKRVFTHTALNQKPEAQELIADLTLVRRELRGPWLIDKVSYSEKPK